MPEQKKSPSERGFSNNAGPLGHSHLWEPTPKDVGGMDATLLGDTG